MINRTKKILKSKIFRFFIFCVILYFTFVLRAHNYDRVPTANHLDEMLYAWSGLYLIETGIPVSWSTLDYPDRAEVFKGIINYKGGLPSTSVTLYRPWLDEPPLFSLIVGYFAHINGADRHEFVPSSFIRIPTVIFAAVTSVLVFLIARLVSGYWTGILSMLLYGTIPVIVFASRTAMPENFIAMIFTLIIYLLLKFYLNQKFRYLIVLPFLIGMAGLAKPTGYFLLPITIFIVFVAYFHKKQLSLAWKSMFYIIALTLPFIGLFFWYGLSMDPEIFWQITSVQSHRPVGFGSLAWFFITPSYDTIILRDSWYVFCLVAAGYFIIKSRLSFKTVNEFNEISQIVLLAFVYWVIIVMISGGENDLLSWYRFPALPFLAIIGAWGLQVVVKKSDFFSSFLVFGMLLGNRMLLVNAFRPNIEPMNYRFIFSGLMFPSLLSSVFHYPIFQKISKIFIVGAIIVGIYFNVVYIYNAFEIQCESKTCPIVPSTSFSTLHFPILWRLIDLGEPKYR